VPQTDNDQTDSNQTDDDQDDDLDQTAPEEASGHHEGMDFIIDVTESDDGSDDVDLDFTIDQPDDDHPVTAPV